MRSVDTFEAKTQFSALLERVSRGDRITITRRGVPVALLVPVPQGIGRDPAQAAAHIRELRKSNFLGDLAIPALIDQGRL